jgi:hypothetical protein
VIEAGGIPDALDRSAGLILRCSSRVLSLCGRNIGGSFFDSSTEFRGGNIGGS